MARQLVSWVLANELLDFKGTSERAVALQQAVLSRLHAGLADHNALRLIRMGIWIMRTLSLISKILPRPSRK